MIKTDFWTDTYVEELPPYEKLILIYLYTNPATNISGLYQTSIGTISGHTNIPRPDVKVTIESLVANGKIFFEDGLVFIPKFSEHQNSTKWGQFSDIIEKAYKSFPLRHSNKSFIAFSEKYKDYIEEFTNPSENPSRKTTEKESISIDNGISNGIIELNVENSECSELLYECIKANSPTFKKPNIEKWNEHIDKLHRLDGQSYDTIKVVIRWCQTKGNFWVSNILSTKKLREKYQTLYLQMNNGKSNGFQKTEKTATSDSQHEKGF